MPNDSNHSRQLKPANAMGIQDTDEHVGLVAQEVQKAIPEAITKNGSGYLLLNNEPILWAMLNAIKERQRSIQKQQVEIRAQEAHFEAQQVQIKAQKHQERIQKAEIVELMSQLKLIQASLHTNGRTSSDVRVVKAQVPLVHQ